MQLVAALMATLAVAQTGPAVTVTAPDRATVIERGAIERWAGVVNGERRALEVLIRSAWYEGEARELGIVVTDEQVSDRLGAEGNARPRGLTRQDFADYLRSLLATEALLERITTAATQSVTQEHIDAYVQAHPRTEPEARTLRVVVTRRERDARLAKRAIRRGATWRTVTKRYAIAGLPGRVRKITRDALPARLRRPAFEASKGRLLGPIRTQFGYFVAEVVEIVPERPTPVKTQRAAAWEILAGEAQQQALLAYESALISKWRPRTICAADLADHRDCGNT